MIQYFFISKSTQLLTSNGKVCLWFTLPEECISPHFHHIRTLKLQMKVFSFLYASKIIFTGVVFYDVIIIIVINKYISVYILPRLLLKHVY